MEEHEPCTRGCCPRRRSPARVNRVQVVTLTGLLGVSCFRFGDSCLGYRVSGLEIRAWGSGCRVWGVGCRDSPMKVHEPQGGHPHGHSLEVYTGVSCVPHTQHVNVRDKWDTPPWPWPRSRAPSRRCRHRRRRATLDLRASHTLGTPEKGRCSVLPSRETGALIAD